MENKKLPVGRTIKDYPTSRFIAAFAFYVAAITQFFDFLFNGTTGKGKCNGDSIKGYSRITPDQFNDLSRTYPELYPELLLHLAEI